ncbi:MAG: MBL fold metallo-hydrolase [Bacteroidota bacterium]
MTTERNGVRVYTYVSPASSNHVTSHIIEAETGLVVVDAQFQVPYAQELKRILSGMEKPVERVVISHAHPDHFYGLSVAFEDVPIYALAATQDAIATTGQGMLDGQRQQMGQLLPETVLAPTQTLTEGAMTIDGLDFEFERVEDAEAPEQVIVRLPSAGIHIVQDLAYNQVHLFTGNDTIDSWMGVLSGMTDLDGAVLVGHGRPTTAAVFQQDIEYLRQTIDARTEAGTPEAFMNAMREAYPGWPGDALLGFSAAMLYAR